MVLKAHGDQVRSDPGIHNDLGILIQQVEAVPGQWYLATADIQMTPSFEHAFPHLQLRFQNARGQQTNHLARLLAHRPGWHTVAVLAQAPKDATTLRIMPTASGIRDGQVHFDRITLTPLSAELREATP